MMGSDDPRAPHNWLACAYCRQSHPTQAELEACGDRFWARVDANAQREREIDAYLKHHSEVERESFE